MFGFFNREDTKPDDAKGYRDALLRFIKEELQKLEGGEGSHVRGLNLYIASTPEEQHLYESAVYLHDSGRFRAEIQKIADDYAIELPAGWQLEVLFTDELPPNTRKMELLAASLLIRTKQTSLPLSASCRISVLNGKAEKDEYLLNSEQGTFTIGRDKKAQMEDGFFRINDIAFPSESSDPANRYISRQHAHIRWDKQSGCFLLYADEGGVPPRNKVKVKSRTSEELVKLHSVDIGHRLQDGDQVIIGETAVLEFRYSAEK